MKHDCPAVLRVAAVLLVLTLFSLCISSGLYARYTTSAEAKDAARVAAFSVAPGETYTSAAIPFENMAPGENRIYSFTITSQSEVAVRCMATLSTTGNLPLTFTSGATLVLSDTPVEIAALTPNQGEVTLNLKASWPADKNDLKYLYEIDAVRLTISAEQID